MKNFGKMIFVGLVLATLASCDLMSATPFFDDPNAYDYALTEFEHAVITNVFGNIPIPRIRVSSNIKAGIGGWWNPDTFTIWIKSSVMVGRTGRLQVIAHELAHSIQGNYREIPIINFFDKDNYYIPEDLSIQASIEAEAEILSFYVVLSGYITTITRDGKSYTRKDLPKLKSYIDKFVTF